MYQVIFLSSLIIRSVKNIYKNVCFTSSSDCIKDRKQPCPWHDYDIVYGPIADDGVSFQLRRYESGYLTIEQLVEELKYEEGITFQYYFANEKAIAKLTRI